MSQTMSGSVDWGSVAEWLQILAIVGTGFGAIKVAGRQLGAYNAALKSSNDNERFRNSIKAFDDMQHSTELMGTKTSPLNAVLNVTQAAADPNKVTRFKSFPERQRRADSSAANDQRWYVEVNENIAIALGFFLDLGMLLERKLVDFDYVMTKASGYIIRLDNAITVLQPLSLDVPAFRRFASLAREYKPPARPST
jgi:hypothetical protein